MLPNAGDELQGIKKGILELADAIVINKADGANLASANLACQHYQSALGILKHSDFWEPRVSLCSAIEHGNIEPLWAMIEEYSREAKANGYFQCKRSQQNCDWMWRLIHELIDQRLKQNSSTRSICSTMTDNVISGKTTPYIAAHQIVDSLLNQP